MNSWWLFRWPWSFPEFAVFSRANYWTLPSATTMYCLLRSTFIITPRLYLNLKNYFFPIFWKIKVAQYRTVKSRKGGRGIALPDKPRRWMEVGGHRHIPDALPRIRTPMSAVQWAGWGIVTCLGPGLILWERCIQNIGGVTCGKETTCKTQA
jgi:hypothetical protein